MPERTEFKVITLKESLKFKTIITISSVCLALLLICRRDFKIEMLSTDLHSY